jgi:hypothetical protein
MVRLRACCWKKSLRQRGDDGTDDRNTPLAVAGSLRFEM